MNFLCDEGIERPIVERLRQEKHEVVYVAELAPEMDDDLVLEEANRRSAILVTTDKDFGELVVRQQRLTTGVLLLRLAGLSLREKTDLVAAAAGLHGPEFVGAFAVLTPGKLRIRKIG